MFLYYVALTLTVQRSSFKRFKHGFVMRFFSQRFDFWRSPKDRSQDGPDTKTRMTWGNYKLKICFIRFRVEPPHLYRQLKPERL